MAGQKRLELTGASTAEMAWLKSLGCFTEIHQYQLRLFVPTDDSVSDEAIALRIITAIAAAGSSAGLSASVASVAAE